MSFQPKSSGRRTRISSVVAALAVAIAGIAAASSHEVSADVSPVVMQQDLVGPVGSAFGDMVLVLSNGNYVVTDPGFDNGATLDVGAVHLYDGATDTVISTITGTTADDQIGSNGVVEVGDSEFVILSPSWDNGVATDAGAATFGDGASGISGAVSTLNSLHGTTTNDRVGSIGVTPLTNGNYTVASPNWDNGATIDAGAVTFANGTSGITGAVSTTNSLHGTTNGDQVGNNGVTPLTNGKYTVNSPNWDNGATTDAGAVTFSDGTSGISGAVSTLNSLHGTTTNDRVGSIGVTPLTNGNYIVASPFWDNGATTQAGAVTFANGTTGITGAVSTTNSLHGTTTGDLVGNSGVTALTNGNYTVASPFWNNGATTFAGAVTFANGTSGITGAVSTTNSLHGTTMNDAVGSNGVTALTNGNYTVASPSWNNGATTQAGAVTFANGTTGITGAVSTTNSLHGTTNTDAVGSNGVTALTNGNYTVASPSWNNGATTFAGAVTFANGTNGITGAVSTTNSLHGTTNTDAVGSNGVTALTNGNYTVASALWDNGATTQAGAVTFANGTNGITGAVSTTNSLHGTTNTDAVGSGGVTALTNGNYTVNSPNWDNGATVDAGAVTFAVAGGGVTGQVAVSNSAIGTPPGAVSAPGDRLTSNDALPIPTTQNRVLLLQIDRAPFFTETPSDVTASTEAGVVGTVVDYPTPTASDLRSTPAVACAPASGTRFAIGDTTVTCTATDSAGLNARTAFTVEVTTTPAITSLEPARLLDTRSTGETIDDQFEKTGKLAGEGLIELDVLGRGGVPDSGVGAVVLNVTMIRPDSNGFVTIYPCGTRPLASSMNAPAGGDVVANEVIAKLSPTGTVCLYTSTPTHLAADLTGYIPTTSSVMSLEPARLLDTRSTGETIDDQFEKTGKLAGEGLIELDVLGRGGVPDSGVGAVVLNVTMIRPDSNGFVTIYPCGTRPLASSMNAPAGGDVVANEVIAKLSPTGTVCLYTSTPTHLAADLTGYIPTTSSVMSLEPARLLDTRSTGETIDDQFEKTGKLAGEGLIELDVLGRGGVPDSGVGAVVLNVTMIRPDSNGFVTIYPCGTRPLASSMNAPAGGDVVANEVIAKLSPTGTVCLYTSTPTHLAADLTGYIAI